MPQTIKLAARIEQQLPADLARFIQAAGEAARSQGTRLYLVGGVVRDLLLGQANLDLDMVVEGDAISLAQWLAAAYPGKLTTHARFGTAKLEWDSRSVDLTKARSESYARPGALPTVKPGSINDDLFRRDFTVNAMAICLTPDCYGELIDLYGGRDDLDGKLIRVLHEKSFIDDATRIWRAIRYEQRLDFQIEPDTLKLLKRDINMLDTITADRIRYELECVFKERYPEKVLRRAGALGVLAKLNPSLKADGWLAEKFEQARRLSLPDLPSFGLYLALLAYPLTQGETEQFISYLKLPKVPTQTLRNSHTIKAQLNSLADPALKPSQIYHALCGFSIQAITTNLIATDSPAIRQHLSLYLDKLRYVKPALTGNDLKRMGIEPGPLMKEVLEKLREARLDGKVKSRGEEAALVREFEEEMDSSALLKVPRTWRICCILRAFGSSFRASSMRMFNAKASLIISP